MPFKSQAQRRKFAELLMAAKISAQTIRGMEPRDGEEEAAGAGDTENKEDQRSDGEMGLSSEAAVVGSGDVHLINENITASCASSCNSKRFRNVPSRSAPTFSATRRLARFSTAIRISSRIRFVFSIAH
jgi:hypothetical protein